MGHTNAVRYDSAWTELLIPDGCNWKAILVTDQGDTDQRRTALAGLERRVWVKIDAFVPLFAAADEDLYRRAGPRSWEGPLVCFELAPEQVVAAKAGAPVAIGCDHPNYRYALDPLPGNIRAALVKDFD